MIRYCSIFLAAILLSGCGNFLGNMGERMNSNDGANERKQVQSAKQRPDLK